MRACPRCEGLPEGPEGLPEGPEVLSEESKGQSEGPKGLPEGLQGLPEGPEGLPGAQGGTYKQADIRTYRWKDRWAYGISQHSTGPRPLSGPLPKNRNFKTAVYSIALPKYVFVFMVLLYLGSST